MLPGILSIAASGMNNATLRVSNTANNIANSSSTARLPTAGAAYSGFQPQDVVASSASAGGGVTSSLRPRDPSYLPAAGPTSSDADANGLVATPNVDIAAELIDTKVAQVSYDANAAVIRTVDRMQKTVLDTWS